MDFNFRWEEPILSVTQTKRQHYVPRAYLRQFLEHDNLIGVTDLVEDREFRASVDNIAVGRRFYDVEIDGVTYSAEDWLANVESQAMPVIRRLVQRPSSIDELSLKEENALARYIAAFSFRTPAFRIRNESTSSSQVSLIKDKVREILKLHLGESAGERRFREIQDKPLHWWYEEEEPPQPASVSTYMLGETQGFANLIRAAPWRIGKGLGTKKLYTSDNPVSRYLPPIRPWWDSGAFSSYEYYFPLSPRVLLKIERRPYEEGSEADRPLPLRLQSDFTATELSLAQHIVSYEANRYLFGEESIVPKKSAEAMLFLLEYAIPELVKRFFPETSDSATQSDVLTRPTCESNTPEQNLEAPST